jgi:WD40 repeat protein
MKPKKNFLIRVGLIGGGVWFLLYVLFPALHIAIPGPLWTESSWFQGNKMSFSFEKQLDITGVSTLSWSTDGRYLLLGTFANTRLKVIDTKDWSVVGSITGVEAGEVDKSVMGFFPNGHTVLIPAQYSSTSKTTSLQAWNASTNTIKKNFNDHFNDDTFNDNKRYNWPKAIAISGDGKVLAGSVSGEKGDVFVFDYDTSRIIQRIHCANLVPEALALNGTGDVVVIGGCHVNKISFYDVKTGQLKYETYVGNRSDEYNFISFSPDEAKVAIASSDSVHGTITVLRGTDGSLLQEFPREQASITNMQWIGNDRILVSYDNVNPGGSMARIFDLSSGQCVEEFGRTDFNLISFGLYLASGGVNIIPTGLELVSMDNSTARVALSTGWRVIIARVQK